MERADRARLIALPGAYTAQPLNAPGPLALDEETAHHLRVRRLDVGDELRVTDGLGALGSGPITTLGKRSATMEVVVIHGEPPPPPVRLLVPIADRERMLWLAEKSAELGLQRWTPLRWDRSRSVSPRGEGEPFRAKVRARMVAALVQSGGAWLPIVEPESDGASFAEHAAAGNELRLLLDAEGPPLLTLLMSSLGAARAGGGMPRVTVALGPEGGLTGDEASALVGAGFLRCALGARVLRFETAAIAALALVGAVIDGGVGAPDGRPHA